MRASPVSQEIRNLDDWQVGLIYEIAMNYPIQGLRKSYFDSKKSVANIDDEEMLDMGYTMEEIAGIKGRG